MKSINVVTDDSGVTKYEKFDESDTFVDQSSLESITDNVETPSTKTLVDPSRNSKDEK